MLPEGWKRVPLGECARFQSGGTPSKERGDYWGGDFPWVTAKDMKTLCLTGSELRLTKSGKEVAAIAPALSVLVLTRGMTLLKDLPVGLAMQDVSFNQDVKALIAKDGIDPWYLAYQLVANKSEILDLVDTAGHGTGRLDTELLKAFELPIAPPEEQQAAAQIIRAWEAAIATNEKLLANSRRQKQALIQVLLSSRLKKWKQVRLADISERVQRQSDGEEHPVLMISSGSGFVRQDEKYSRFMAGKSLENYVLLQRGEFAYNKGNSKLYEFGCVFPLEELTSGLVPHVYVCFKLNTKCDQGFFKYLFEADYLHDQLGALVNTGVRNNGLLNIRPADFMNAHVPLPPLAEQRAIASVLETASNEIECFKKDIEALKRQKRALMQQLLTGKRCVRLPATEAANA